ADDKPLVAYLCLRVPVETIEACGAIPLRIAPLNHTAEATFSPVRTDGCSFCRQVPAIMRAEPFHRAAAVIAGSCCDQMRRITETLHTELGVPVFLFGAPRTWGSDPEYFILEMTVALEQISRITGHLPSEAELRFHIRERNRLRRLVTDLRRARKLNTALLHAIAKTPLPPGEVCCFLNDFQERKPLEAQLNLLLAGSIPGVWELEFIEENGCRITADATCLGDRVFHRLVPESGDPLKQLYFSIVEENDCPHRRPVQPLLDTIAALAAERNVDGIIYCTLKYCHPWGLLVERMKDEFDLPLLWVDDDFASPAVSAFRTRVGAFREMLQMRRRRRA
ncbi:MAG: 2-hydroxyacyl-CoA dehydratase family protein, partial [bacterium]